MNKIMLKLFSVIILTIILLTICNISKATIENKPGGTVYTNVSVSTAYQFCYNMRDKNDSSLGNNTLDPHLTTNADWAAVAYLGVSVYGSVRSKTGTAVTIDETEYYSTTNNITGVMNMGKNYTQTAALVTEYQNNSYITELKNNLNTKYVETLGSSASDTTNKGRAFGETSGWYGSTYQYSTKQCPAVIRSGVLGFYNFGMSTQGNGRPLSNATFRPVIWN